KEGCVITFVTHKEELKQLKKYATVAELVLHNQKLHLK
ncbi:TPA: ATP-dependent helicase, partial [Streptococcus agalactiae]|nr:ATP-dependent helicase [Streptococcus agalactiae]